MNHLLLAITIGLSGTNAVIRCVTPGPGSYSVQCSADAHNWRVLASGYVKEASHVTVLKEACNQAIRIYRVEWRANNE